ncbi:hypothetical protein [Nonomuraea soli]|uniref:Uncharacterized protein n=1 Tax=Nonomuraea soli TaxID=1032476 RepID=A0A7W0HRN9_9ACTN|nr:hypothetical protein [Nonomuraea soli]MBA2893198.1 hypothetical protein [Nonomuraea soli]
MSPTRLGQVRWWAARLLTTSGLLLMVGGAGLGVAGLQLSPEIVGIAPLPGVETFEVARPLPLDGPAGEGIVLHAECLSGCPVLLITRQGGEFHLGPGVSLESTTLSPDGRLLATSRPGGGVLVRELTSDRDTLVVPPRSAPGGSRLVPWGWTGDLLVMRHVRAGRDGWATAGLDGSRTHDLKPTAAEVAGMRATALTLDLVALRESGDRRHLRLYGPDGTVRADLYVERLRSVISPAGHTVR